MTAVATLEIHHDLSPYWNYALDFADDSLKRNREVVMTAIAKDPAALRYALDESLRQDPEIIQALKPPPFSRPSYVSGLII